MELKCSTDGRASWGWQYDIFFVNYPHLNSTYAAEQFLGGTKAFFLPRSSYTKDFYDTLR